MRMTDLIFQEIMRVNKDLGILSMLVIAALFYNQETSAMAIPRSSDLPSFLTNGRFSHQGRQKFAIPSTTTTAVPSDWNSSSTAKTFKA
jgi:hypothetical protein